MLRLRSRSRALGNLRHCFSGNRARGHIGIANVPVYRDLMKTAGMDGFTLTRIAIRRAIETIFPSPDFPWENFDSRKRTQVSLFLLPFRNGLERQRWRLPGPIRDRIKSAERASSASPFPLERGEGALSRLRRRHGYHRDEENGGFHSVGLSPGAQRRWKRLSLLSFFTGIKIGGRLPSSGESSRD